MVDFGNTNVGHTHLKGQKSILNGLSELRSWMLKRTMCHNRRFLKYSFEVAIRLIIVDYKNTILDGLSWIFKIQYKKIPQNSKSAFSKQVFKGFIRT